MSLLRRVNFEGFVPSFKDTAEHSAVNVFLSGGYGNFTFHFVMYTDHRYVQMHSYYPVAVKVRDFIYLEIYANNIDSNIVVLIDQCYSTPTMDRNHPMKYTFISNR